MKLMMLVIALTAVSAACSADAPKPATPAAFALTGSSSFIRQERQVVVRDAKAMKALWQAHVGEGNAPAPTIDFKQYDVIAVFAGEKSTGGYSVAIADPVVTRKGATINATVYKPGRGMMVTQAFTYPYAMRAVKKLPQKVDFKVQTAERK